MGPWKVQQPYLTDAFKQAQDLYNKNSATPGYQGDFTAGQNPNQANIQKGAYDYFTGNATGMANEIQNAASGLAQTGAGGLTNTASGLYGIATGDSAGNNIANAQRYASGLDLDALTNAATYGARRQAAEGDIPNLYRAAAASGNLNSDRTALAQGVVERGLAENAQNIRSQLGADAYNTGLQMAQGDQAQALQAYNAAGSQYDQAIARGSGGLTDAFNLQTQALGNAYDYASQQQQGTQQDLTNAVQKYNYAEQRPYDLLNNYYSIIGSQNWGQNGTSTTNSTTTSTPSPLQVAGGVLGGLGSLFGPGTGAGMAAAGLKTGGTLAGSAAGAAGGGSLFSSMMAGLGMLSDETMKTDIEKLGKDPGTGLDMYAYRYKGDPKNYPKIVGPMAQDVAKRYPDAVDSVGGKLYIKSGSLLG
jgi:hypothetical protein